MRRQIHGSGQGSHSIGKANSGRETTVSGQPLTLSTNVKKLLTEYFAKKEGIVKRLTDAKYVLETKQTKGKYNYTNEAKREEPIINLLRELLGKLDNKDFDDLSIEDITPTNLKKNMRAINTACTNFVAGINDSKFSGKPLSPTKIILTLLILFAAILVALAVALATYYSGFSFIDSLVATMGSFVGYMAIIVPIALGIVHGLGSKEDLNKDYINEHKAILDLKDEVDSHSKDSLWDLRHQILSEMKA